MKRFHAGVVAVTVLSLAGIAMAAGDGPQEQIVKFMAKGKGVIQVVPAGGGDVMDLVLPDNSQDGVIAKLKEGDHAKVVFANRDKKLTLGSIEPYQLKPCEDQPNVYLFRKYEFFAAGPRPFAAVTATAFGEKSIFMVPMVTNAEGKLVPREDIAQAVQACREGQSIEILLEGLNPPMIKSVKVFDLPKIGAPTPAPPAENEKPTTIAGVIKDLPAGGSKPVTVLGHQGCLVIRSPERWKAVADKLADAGWTEKEDLLKIDFNKQIAVLAFNYGDQGDKFFCRNYSGNADKSALDLQVNYGGYRRRDKAVNCFHYLLIIMSQSKKLEVAVSTSGYDSTAPNDRAAPKLEWKAAFGPDSGDIVDGLRGTIHCGQKTVKAGADISVIFTLERAKPEEVENGHFAKPVGKLFVWDCLYSKGYRNHAFLVKTPDGKEVLLRPKAQGFDENAPHPVEIASDKPYVLLPKWADNAAGKSLKELGLDTSQPGTYTITGIYAETAQETTVDNKPVSLWGGNIATNTIMVKVTKD